MADASKTGGLGFGADAGDSGTGILNGQQGNVPVYGWLPGDPLQTGTRGGALPDNFGAPPVPGGYNPLAKTGNFDNPTYQKGLKNGPAGPASKGDSISAQLQAFFDELNKPLDLNDPYVHQVIQGASNAASADARNRGIGGPLSVANTQDMATKTYAGLDMQRRGLAANALGALSGRDVSLQDLAEKRNEFNTGMQNAYALGNYQNAQNEAGGMGALAGGTIGALGFFGGPALGAATTAAGASLGGGLSRGMSGNTLPAPSLIPKSGGGY